MKIGLIGCAGCGKGYTAQQLSKKLNLPYLCSKDITRPILQKYEYKYDENNYVEKFLSKKDIEFQIVDQRIFEEDLLSCGFVSDRTTLECFCYSFLNICSYSEDEFSLLENLCKSSVEKYDYLFYFPRDGSWLENNGIRTTNGILQWKIDILIRGIIDDWNLNVIEIPVEIMEKREMTNFILNNINK